MTVEWAKTEMQFLKMVQQRQLDIGWKA